MLQTQEILKNQDSPSSLVKEQKNPSPDWILDFTPTTNLIRDFSDHDFFTLEHSTLVSHYLHLIIGGVGQIEVSKQFYAIQLDEKSYVHTVELLQLCGLNLEKDFVVDKMHFRIFIYISDSDFLKHNLDEAEGTIIKTLQKLAFSSLLTRLTHCAYPIQQINIGFESYNNYEKFTVEGDNLEKINLIVKTLLVDCKINTSHNRVVLKGNKILHQLHNIYFARVHNLQNFCQENIIHDEAYQGALNFLTKLIFGAGGLTNTMIAALGQSEKLNNGTKLIAAQNWVHKLDNYSIYKTLDFKSSALFAINNKTPCSEGDPLSRSQRIQILEKFMSTGPEL